jgi:hypothetical protein
LRGKPNIAPNWEDLVSHLPFFEIRISGAAVHVDEYAFPDLCGVFDLQDPADACPRSRLHQQKLSAWRKISGLLLIGVLAAGSLRADVTILFREVDGNVAAYARGSIDVPALGHVWALRAPTGSSSETAGDLYLQRTADSVYEYTSSDLYVRGTGLHTDPDSSDGDSFGYHHYYLYLPLYARDLPSYSPNTNWYWNNTTIGGIGLGWLPATGSAKVFSLNGQSIYYALYNTSMLAASSIDFGRVMAGSYQSTKLWVSRTGEGTALISSATAEGPLELIVHNTVVDDTPRGIDVILDTGATGKLADSKITLVNTANNVYGPQTLTVSVGGTVVANREVTGEADISHKKVLVNHLLTGQVDITSAGDRDNFADVTVLGTAVTNNGNVTVEAGGDTLFNAP